MPVLMAHLTRIGGPALAVMLGLLIGPDWGEHDAELLRSALLVGAEVALADQRATLAGR